MSKMFHDYVYAIIKRINKKCESSRVFAKHGIDFINRSNNNSKLLLIIAGFQNFYWDTVFERVNKNQKQITDLDVCLVVPGADGTLLKNMPKDMDGLIYA